LVVREEGCLGDKGQRSNGLMGTFDISRVALGAAAVGAARAAHEYALEYAKTPKQFGVAIVDHQPLRSGWPCRPAER
jgi:acyl-CoA dehydrogenase